MSPAAGFQVMIASGPPRPLSQQEQVLGDPSPLTPRKEGEAGWGTRADLLRRRWGPSDGVPGMV